MPSTKHEEQRRSILDENGHEVPGDHTPSIPIRFKTQETIQAQVQRLVAYEISLYADANGYETFDEADDFDVDDDMFPTSRHEMTEEIETYDRNQGWADAEKDYVTRELKRRQGSSKQSGEARENGGEGTPPRKRTSGHDDAGSS